MLSRRSIIPCVAALWCANAAAQPAPNGRPGDSSDPEKSSPPQGTPPADQSDKPVSPYGDQGPRTYGDLAPRQQDNDSDEQPSAEDRVPTTDELRPMADGRIPGTDPTAAIDSSEPEVPEPPRGPVLPDGHPRMFVANTAHMTPAAVIYSSTGIDTSGGIASDLRIGLGGVGEFGIEHFDQVRWRTPDGENSYRVAPMFLATFKLGLGENRFFIGQPALAIGFRKSFQAEENVHALRMAELFVMASKSLSDRFQAHIGGVIGDAEVENVASGQKAFLHDRPLSKQAKMVGGMELEALPDSKIILEWSYVPQFVLRAEPLPTDMSMRAQFLWGVRYGVSRSAFVEAGVRVGDIAETNLIDAHIFGRLTLATDALQRAFD